MPAIGMRDGRIHDWYTSALYTPAPTSRHHPLITRKSVLPTPAPPTPSPAYPLLSRCGPRRRARDAASIYRNLRPSLIIAFIKALTRELGFLLNEVRA